MLKSSRLPSLSVPAAILTALLIGTPWSFSVAQEEAPATVVPIAGPADDAEEFLGASLLDPARWPVGYTYTGSSDLELGSDPDHGPQVVGLRFTDIPLPAGAAIERAFIRFTSDSAQDGPVSVRITVAAGPAASAIEQDPDGSGGLGLTSRPTLPGSVEWQPEGWSAGSEHDTPDLTALVQQALSGPDWGQGGALVFILTPVDPQSQGFRSAYSHDGSPGQAPRLVIEGVGGEPAAEPAQPAGEPFPAPVPDEPAPVEPEPAPTPADPEPAAPLPRDPARLDAPERLAFPIEPRHADEVAGTILVSDYGLGRSILSVGLRGAAPHGQYRVTLHRGGCNAVDELRTLLGTVEGESGLGTFVVDVDASELLGQPHHVNVLRLGEFTRLVGCANLTP